MGTLPPAHGYISESSYGTTSPVEPTPYEALSHFASMRLVEDGASVRVEYSRDAWQTHQRTPQSFVAGDFTPEQMRKHAVPWVARAIRARIYALREIT